MNTRMTMIAIVMLGVSACGLTGCNILGPVVQIVDGPATKDAEFRLPDVPTVTFVDDRRNALGDRGMRRYIGDKISEHLLNRSVLSSDPNNAISTASALIVAGSDRTSELKSLETIGKEVEASQVILVEMMSFSLETVNGRPTAQATVRVKIIDVDNQVRIYPPPSTGTCFRNLIVELPPALTFQPMLTTSSRREAEKMLGNLVAEKVAKLFYKHERRSGIGNSIAPKSQFD